MGHITVPYHLNEPIDPYPVSVPDGLAVKGPRPQGETWDAFVPLYTSIAQIVFGTENPIVWTGDCAVSLAVVAGLQRRGIDPAVVWIDAHADFNTPQTTVTGYLGGMPLAMLTQRGEVDLAMHIGMRAIPDDRVILAGPRDVDPAEEELLGLSALHRMQLDELGPGILPSGSVYLHVDLDILDPKELPGMRFATPGGASLDDLAAAIEAVTSSTRVVAVSFTFTLGEEQDAERTKAVSDRLLDALRRGGFHP